MKKIYYWGVKQQCSLYTVQFESDGNCHVRITEWFELEGIL